MAHTNDIRSAVEKVHTWSQGEYRAPHKPLLLLLALGRVQRGEPRLVAFSDVDRPLKDLLVQFGRTENHQPELPFWWLRSDGLWEVPDGDALVRRKGSNAPTRAALRTASGGLPLHIDRALREDPALLREIAHAILAAHFAPSLHESILSAVNLDLEAPVATGLRRVRDRRFRELVLRAYGYQCAVCGLDTRLDGQTIGLEAAHVQWHCNQGPDLLENGVCFCPLHHKVFDLGLMSLGPDSEILVSARLHGGLHVESQIGRFHRRALIRPTHTEVRVGTQFASWHRGQVFKSPAR